MRWLLSHWYLPFLALAGVAIFVLTRGKSIGPVVRVSKELDAIKARHDAQADEIKRGATLAKAKIQEEHKETLKRLDVEEKELADKIASEKDLGKMAEMLARLS